MPVILKRGIVALLPLVAAIAIVYLLGYFFCEYIGKPFGQIFRLVAVILGVESQPGFWKWLYENGYTYYGIVFALGLAVLAGGVIATFYGKAIFGGLEKAAMAIPVIKNIYPYTKQFTDVAFGTDKERSFKSVAVFRLAAEGPYYLCFVVAEGVEAFEKATGKELTIVFVPTSPTPFGGFVMLVPTESVVPVQMSVGDAMRMIVSGGVLAPGQKSGITLPRQ